MLRIPRRMRGMRSIVSAMRSIAVAKQPIERLKNSEIYAVNRAAPTEMLGEERTEHRIGAYMSVANGVEERNPIREANNVPTKSEPYAVLRLFFKRDL